MADQQVVEPPKKRKRRGSPLAGLARFFQSAAFRNIMISLGFFAVELLLASRYGADTFRIGLHEQATLNGHCTQLLACKPTTIDYVLASISVAVIDALFLVMLVVAKHAGASMKASKIRPFAALGAIAVFASMLAIAEGWIAVTLASRVAGALLLAYVVSDVLVDLARNAALWASKRRKDASVLAWRTRLFLATNNIGYVIMLLALSPLAWIVIGTLTVLADYIKLAGFKLERASKDVHTSKSTSMGTTNAQAPARNKRNRPALQARNHAGNAVVTAQYKQASNGEVIWICDACGASSQDANVRGRKTYVSKRIAQRAFAGHAGKHVTAIMAQPVSP